MKHGHAPRAAVSAWGTYWTRIRARHMHDTCQITVNPCPTRVNCFDSPDMVKLSLDTARTRFGQSFVTVYFVIYFVTG